MVTKKKMPKKKEIIKKKKTAKINKSGVILNPKTKRYVKTTGKIGKKLMKNKVVQKGGVLSKVSAKFALKSPIYMYLTSSNETAKVFEFNKKELVEKTESHNVSYECIDIKLPENYRILTLKNDLKHQSGESSRSPRSPSSSEYEIKLEIGYTNEDDQAFAEANESLEVGSESVANDSVVKEMITLPFFNAKSEDKMLSCIDFPVVMLTKTKIKLEEMEHDVYFCIHKWDSIESSKLKGLHDITNSITTKPLKFREYNNEVSLNNRSNPTGSSAAHIGKTLREYWTNYENQKGNLLEQNTNETNLVRPGQAADSSSEPVRSEEISHATDSMPSIYVPKETFQKGARGDLIEPTNEYHIPADMSVYKYTSGSQGAELVYVTFNGNNLENNIGGAYVYFVSSSSSGELPYTFLTLYHYESLDSGNVAEIDVNELQKKLRSQNTSISNIFILGKYKPGIYACIFYPVRLDVLLKDVQPEYDLAKKFFNNYKSN